jgi:hypothetical protein
MTLTELSYYSRRFLPFAIIFLLLFFILFYLFKLFFLFLDLNKPRRIITNPIFGKIQRPQVQKTINQKFNYILDTVEGEPISASETAKVYLIPPASTRFGYREKIYLIAKNFGFDTTAIKHKLLGKEATFTDEKQELTIDITNYNFSYQYRLGSDESFLMNPVVPGREEIENRAIDFLKSINRYPAELAKGKTNLIYLYFDRQTKTLSVVDQPSFANMIEIDFYRPDIDIFPVVSPTYFNSQNYLVMVFQETDFKVVKAQVKFFEKSEEEVGIYPVKTGNTAWEQLKNGQAMVVSAPSNQTDIKIKKIFFAYFDPDIFQNYLQPVYVFLGENNFVAYVPAVADEYLTE